MKSNDGQYLSENSGQHRKQKGRQKLQKKGKRNKYRLAIEGKRRNTGVQGGVPLGLEKKTCQKLRKIQEKGLAIQGKTKNCTKKKQKRGSKGVSS